MLSKFLVAGSESTPYLSFEPDTGLFEIRGSSFPSNAVKFYEPVIEWIKAYCEEPSDRTELHFEMDYFNSSSGKLLLEMLHILSRLHQRGNEILIKWHHTDEDDDMLFAGQEFAKLSNLTFEFILVP